MRQDALRAGQVVDVLARGHHLIGRQRVLVPVAAGHAADDRHRRVAVAEDFLDVVGAVELFEALLERSCERPQHLEETQQSPCRRGVSSYHLLADIDVVRLHVEDELVLGPFLLERLLVLDLVGARPRSRGRRPG